MVRNKYEKCDKCGGKIFLGSFPFCNGQPSDHGSQTQRSGDGVCTVIYRNEKGEVYVPGNDRAVPPKQFGRYEKVEAKTRAQYNRLLKVVTDSDRQKLIKQREERQRRFEEEDSLRSRELRHQMSLMDPEARAYAMEMLRIENTKKPKSFTGATPSVYVDAWENYSRRR